MRTAHSNVHTSDVSTGRAQRLIHPTHWEHRADYNFTHFSVTHLLSDIQRTIGERGIRPGTDAPDFTLVRAGGGMLTLGDLRGRPVLLHFGSPT